MGKLIDYFEQLFLPDQGRVHVLDVFSLELVIHQHCVVLFQFLLNLVSSVESVSPDLRQHHLHILEDRHQVGNALEVFGFLEFLQDAHENDDVVGCLGQ